MGSEFENGDSVEFVFISMITSYKTLISILQNTIYRATGTSIIRKKLFYYDSAL